MVCAAPYDGRVNTSKRAGSAAGTAKPALESDLGWAVRMVSSAFPVVANSAVADLPGGARGYLVLAAVASGEARSQLALAQQLGLNKTVLTYLLDDMESAGLTARRQDPADRRARQIVITEQGEKALARAQELLSVAEGRLLADLTSGEAKQFRGLLERVARTAQHEILEPGDVC
jgi:DNA-binding MarR family transcriptional regulator